MNWYILGFCTILQIFVRIGVPLAQSVVRLATTGMVKGAPHAVCRFYKLSHP